MVLRMESPAPPIKVQSWLRGQHLKKFQPGKMYIVEFWATWCGPCVEAMPHLVQLQEQYRDRGLGVIGVAASESAPTADEARTKLEAWLTEKFPKLNYRIAFDYSGEMNKLWMEPSFSVGIPTSFVVDRDGQIAFIGHPTRLDDVLPKVLDGIWRTSDEAKAADTNRIDEGQRIAREVAVIKPIFAKLQPAMKAKDWKAAFSAVEEGLGLMPNQLVFRRLHVHLLLHKMRDIRTGLPAMGQLIRDAIDQRSQEWMTIAISELFDPTIDTSHLPRAERFAMGRDLSEHILALNFPQDGYYKLQAYEAVAQYFYESGNKERAIELVELALKSAEDPKSMQNDRKQLYVPRLLQALANYKGEKACYGELCSAPQAKASREPDRKISE
ncbi:TlpA disulfide reductase family protein [Bradyrhizobium sp. UFLA01-814]|uniref:TlpA disulfide reductase family protein n=1 Tax=Bradyrhizobium sp. UFLA01-814 TaxID=3023480 RepID=UPI00398B5F27